MKLSAPTNIVFIIAVVLAALALLGKFVIIGGAIAANAFWILLVAFLVIAAGCLLKGV